MLSLCFTYMATVASPFHSSIFHFLAKLSKTPEIFSCEKKTMKLSLLHKNVNMSNHRKGDSVALTAVYQFEFWLKVWDKPSKLSLPRQGPWSLVWVKQVFEFSEVELTEFHCTSLSQQSITTLNLVEFTCYIKETAFCIGGGGTSWNIPERSRWFNYAIHVKGRRLYPFNQNWSIMTKYYSNSRSTYITCLLYMYYNGYK